MFARLLILIITVPVVELILFIKIGTRIGMLSTFVIILLTGILGAWLTKLQGMRTLARYQQAVNEGRLPHEEVIDGLLHWTILPSVEVVGMVEKPFCCFSDFDGNSLFFPQPIYQLSPAVLKGLLIGI